MKADSVFIIAELSANHNNDINLAIETIEAIAKTGADAVKVQTYTADSLVLNVKNEYFQAKKDGLWKGRNLYDLYKEASLPYEWHDKLKEITESFGMTFFSSPFSINDFEFLETLNVPLYKIASFEINHIPLIHAVAKTGKPIIISTGVATEEDIDLAVKTCLDAGNTDITLLKCTSNYPAKIKDANLNTIPDLKAKFKTKVGVSDHTMGFIVPAAAVALGATVVEKHFILDRSLGGVDSEFSMEPDEFKQMVETCRAVHNSLGEITYKQPESNSNRKRSIFVAKDIKKGEQLSTETIKIVRPGNGLHPKYYEEILGKTALKDVTAGTPLSLDMIQQ